jgi:phosphoglycerate kinase
MNDAFSVSHRAHASVEAITHHLPAHRGLLMEKELSSLEALLKNPKLPLMAIVGGAKVSSKIGLLKNLSKRVNTLAIMGGMANTFLEAQGYETGTSLVEREKIKDAQDFLLDLDHRGCEVILPKDVVVSSRLEPHSPTSIKSINQIPSTQMILDAGPQTVEVLKKALDRSKTLVWNGALGVTEVPPFDQGTLQVMRYGAQRTKEGQLLSVAGGGDTVGALNQAQCAQDFSYVSMAGGAFLEWLQGYPLPGLEALKKRPA